MRKFVLMMFGTLCFILNAQAQGEQNVWVFGYTGLDFNSPVPIPFNQNMHPCFEGSASICDAKGKLLFYTSGFWVWDAEHHLMPELTGGVKGYKQPRTPSIGYPPLMPYTGAHCTQPAAIAAMPGQEGKYYLFSLAASGQLYYSVVDMSLNGGLGGIVKGKQGVFLASGLCGKLTVVKGCNNIWVMTRSRSTNEYRAFELNDTGIVRDPVVSACGALPVSWYAHGVLKFSPDGLKMAAACNEATNATGGLELYDFDPHTGKLSHPYILDSSSNRAYYYGACFSPDNSKLYATMCSFYFMMPYTGTVHQFDLSLGSAAAVLASHTVVFSDMFSGFSLLGDLKRAADGMIYFSQGRTNTMHCISRPDLAGSACLPVADSIRTGNTERGIPNDIALYTPPDSIALSIQRVACFGDSVLLEGGVGKRYIWDNGSTGRQRMVGKGGTYVLHFINRDCHYETDTFIVRFVRLPHLSASNFACPNAKNGVAVAIAEDTTTVRYTWTDNKGNVVRIRSSSYGDTLSGADTGIYYLQLSVTPGCDTVLPVQIFPLPLPQASFSTDSIICAGDEIRFDHTSTAVKAVWYIGDSMIPGNISPVLRYPDKGIYHASLIVRNIEGCSDTLLKEIRVNGFDLRLKANKELVHQGDWLLLESYADQTFQVSGWEPAAYFSDQTARNQSVAFDTTGTFVVHAVSAFGCSATAEVTVGVWPVVHMPNAFTPDGNGMNDRFRPVGNGAIRVLKFEVYNRYGQLLYKASGSAALEGWDGTFGGREQELGTYYYQVVILTPEDRKISLKGDVILIR